jgi:hypothetical protein
MRVNKYQKAEHLLEHGKVKLKSETANAIYFDVFDGKVRDVYYIKNRDHWSCSPCTHFAMTTKPCSHILACRLYLKRRDEDEHE